MKFLTGITFGLLAGFVAISIGFGGPAGGKLLNDTMAMMHAAMENNTGDERVTSITGSQHQVGEYTVNTEQTQRAVADEKDQQGQIESDLVVPRPTTDVQSLTATSDHGPSVFATEVVKKPAVEVQKAHASAQPERAAGFQAAWTPFRSETSAKGFASRLSQQLDGSFRVIKRAPGRYEVGFDYRTEAERKTLLEAIAGL